MSLQAKSHEALTASIEAGHPFVDECGTSYAGRNATQGFAKEVFARYLMRRQKVMK